MSAQTIFDRYPEEFGRNLEDYFADDLEKAEYEYEEAMNFAYRINISQAESDSL
jgi:hypothetical protein